MSATLTPGFVYLYGAHQRLARSAARRIGLLDFTRRLFRGPTGGYEPAPHHVAMAAHLEAIERGDLDRLVVVVPPRHGKSTLISEHFPPWYLGRHPDRRLIACSHTARLAETFSRRARNLLADPRWPFPGVAVAPDLSGVEAWDIAGHRGGYVAAGVGGAIAGHGADCLVVDDPVRSAADAESAVAREATWEWFTADALTRIEPKGACVVVGTRWHESDLIGRILASPEAGRWTLLHLPAIDDDGTALWPQRFPLEALEAIRRDIGSRHFASLYQGRPSVAEGSILKRHWWRFWHHPGDPRPPVWTADERGLPVACSCVPRPATFDDACQSWDLTFKRTEAGSYVVGQVWWRVGADRYLVDQFRHRCDFPDAVLAVQAMAAKHPTVAAKLVEDAANGPALLATLRGRVPGLVAVPPAGSKEARAHAAAAVLEAGNVFLPHPSLATWVDEFVEETAAFPYGSHDDQVDAMSQAMHRLGLASASAIGFSYLGNGREANGYAPPGLDAFGNELPPTGGRRWR